MIYNTTPGFENLPTAAESGLFVGDLPLPVLVVVGVLITIGFVIYIQRYAPKTK
jgi:hypothetical protein